jgi:hypothetical protein
MHETQDIDIAFVGLNPPQKALVLRRSFTGGRKEHEKKHERKTNTDDSPGLRFDHKIPLNTTRAIPVNTNEVSKALT